MVFSSSLFLLYFLPAFLLVYHALPRSFRNYWVLLASILFYSWGAPKFVFVAIGAMVLNYYIVRFMSKAAKESKRKTLMQLSLLLNVGLLLFFKYANFFVENVNMLLENLGFTHITWTSIALPIGISFFIFQSITYTVDVYRKVSPPLEKPTDYILYILLFPQLIAGPIVRFNTIAAQITNRVKFETLDNVLSGFIRFSIGLGKKVLLANVMGKYADQIFAMDHASLDAGLAWVGVVCYGFQIYWDFSGYSDMAIGIGRMIGFTFPENFNVPYISKNITEFWRRWHMTLGTWMRDYLYIPLGGNQVNTRFRLFFNLWVVFLISGLWHGAAWSFIIWGVFHGLFLIFDRLFLIRFTKYIGSVPSILLTYIIVLFSWVIFRSENFSLALSFMGKMWTGGWDFHGIFLNREMWAIIGVSFLFSFAPASKIGSKLMDLAYQQKFTLPTYLLFSVFAILLVVLSVGSITSSGFNPFIYFRF
jgi:alginate O-acetyltransferase complex protein AlgI